MIRQTAPSVVLAVIFATVAAASDSVALITDCSGSMSGKRLVSLKQDAKLAIRQRDDGVDSVVQYGMQVLSANGRRIVIGLSARLGHSRESRPPVFG